MSANSAQPTQGRFGPGLALAALAVACHTYPMTRRTFQIVRRPEVFLCGYDVRAWVDGFEVELAVFVVGGWDFPTDEDAYQAALEWGREFLAEGP